MTGWTTSNAGSTGRITGHRFPFGPWGVALLTAALGAIIGLLIPIAWIEEVSWQLYLDQLIAAARAPLGATAQLVAGAVLASALGLLGWLMATMLKVRPAVGGIAGWLASLRGVRTDDEPDAPALRSADRHPDAPARRPFSASRDVPVDEDQVADGETPSADGDEELLLDAHFDETVAATVEADDERGERWDALEHVEAIDEVAAAPKAGTAVDRIIATEVEPAHAEEAPLPEPVEPEPEPLDLSVARLDELIARLESGLSRRQAALNVAAAASAAAEPGSTEAIAAEEAQPVVARGNNAPVDDTNFPQDPALAAALATLRRMNQSS
jgi:hypothetical protein